MIVTMVLAWLLSSWNAVEHGRYSGLGMDALKIECTRTRPLLWFWHGCSQARMHSNTNGSIAWPRVLSSSSALQHERYDGLCMDALVAVCSWNTNVIMVWTWMLPTLVHSNTIQSLSALEHARYDGSGMMLSSSSAPAEHEPYYGLGMDALIIECTRTRTLLWFGHGCFGKRMLLETRQDCGCF